MSAGKILVYLLRRDLRLADNPILHRLATSKDHGFGQLLPVYIFPAHQIEVSGFLREGEKSPYPEARGEVSGIWRCGPHRAKFIGQSVWDLKDSLTKTGSGLAIRVGRYETVLEDLITGFRKHGREVGGVWMVSEEGVEEKRDEKAIATVCSNAGVPLEIFKDEKHYIDDRDLKLDSAGKLPDIFTNYRKANEDLRGRPRDTLPTPQKGALPSYPSEADIPPQQSPFDIPSTPEDFEAKLLSPVKNFLKNVPSFPEGASSAHPLEGGETHGLARLRHVITSGVMGQYKNLRNGLLGVDFSTKFSAYLALGCITARQVQKEMVAYEDGTNEEYTGVEGFGKGENEGTKAMRMELLWRDYMRLCTRKFGPKLFAVSGFRDAENQQWKTPKGEREGKSEDAQGQEIDKILQRFYEGTTGMGLIDASQRELIHTGYTSNRARQNVASFLAKHLGIDWRFGAEWYEMLLLDYDVSSNWANWQYVAGVGQDPRGEARIFNPVKQAFDYDKGGEYVRCWVPEVRNLEKLENVFQAWTTPKDDWDRLGLTGLEMAENPVKKINFSVDGKFKNSKRPFDRRRRDGGRGRANGGNDGGDGNGAASGGHNGGGSGAQGGHAANGGQYAMQNGDDGSQQQYQYGREPPRSPRNFRGNGYRGGRGGYRGRGGGGGYGGPRGGYGGYGGDGGYHGQQQQGFMLQHQQQMAPQWAPQYPGA